MHFSFHVQEPHRNMHIYAKNFFFLLFGIIELNPSTQIYPTLMYETIINNFIIFSSKGGIYATFWTTLNYSVHFLGDLVCFFLKISYHFSETLQKLNTSVLSPQMEKHQSGFCLRCKVVSFAIILHHLVLHIISCLRKD